MGGPPVRGRIAPGPDVDDVAKVRGWIRASADRLPIDWPSSDHLSVHAVWRAHQTPVALVEDSFILRAYLWSEGPEGSEELQQLAQEGVLLAPSTLLEAARASASWWAELGDTLYDLIAGCIDSDNDDVFEIWQQRLVHEHPLIRLAASWTGPYLVGERVAAALEAVAETDKEPQVREAAAVSAFVMRGRAPG